MKSDLLQENLLICIPISHPTREDNQSYLVDTYQSNNTKNSMQTHRNRKQ